MSIINLPEASVAIRDRVHDFIEREVRPVEERYSVEILRDGRLDFEVAETERRLIRKKSVAEGFYSMAMPEDIGGMGASNLTLVLCYEAIGESGLILAERGGIIASVDGPQPQMLAMNSDQRTRYLDPLMRAEKEACFAVTEPWTGSDATAIRTTAVKDGDHWVINGEKHFITHAQFADFVQLMAVTEAGLGAKGGITCFIIDMGTPGLEIERVMNTVGIDRPCVLSMKDVRVHESQIMGKVGFGFDTVIKFMNQGRFKIAASCVGKAQYLLDLTLKRAKERVAFGRPIGDYQAIQQHLVDSLVELRMCRFLLYECADAADRGENERQAAAVAKYACAEMLGRVADRAVGVFGGNGLLTEYGVERFYRDARGARIYEGTTEVLRGVIAKSLGFANT